MNHGTTPLALPFSKKVGILRLLQFLIFFHNVLAGVSA